MAPDPHYGDVAVQIVTYNSARWIEGCLRSVLGQTVRPRAVLVIDNGSSDDTCLRVERFPGVHLHLAEQNLGFARAHNLGITMTNAPFVLVLNPDVYLCPDYIERLLMVAQAQPAVGAVTGKLLRMDEEGTPTRVIDSAGILIRRDRRATDRGAGEFDHGQYDRPEPVFGVCAAAALYRRQMLADVAWAGEVFDSDFFMYKEDVDLSWRARLAGWECFYEPRAVAYHYRGWREGSRLHQPEHLRVQGLTNRYLLVLKNDQLRLCLRHLPWLMATEVAIFGYMLLRDRSLFKSWVQVFRLLPRILTKRKALAPAREGRWRIVEKWLT